MKLKTLHNKISFALTAQKKAEVNAARVTADFSRRVWMAEKDADRAHMQAGAAETRDAAQRLRFKSELDAARMMINSRFIEHQKRSAAAIHQQKETRSKKQREMSSKLMTELEMANNKHKGEVTKIKQTQDERVVVYRERLAEEKQVTNKVRQMGEGGVVSDCSVSERIESESIILGTSSTLSCPSQST